MTTTIIERPATRKQIRATIGEHVEHRAALEKLNELKAEQRRLDDLLQRRNVVADIMPEAAAAEYLRTGEIAPVPAGIDLNEVARKSKIIKAAIVIQQDVADRLRGAASRAESRLRLPAFEERKDQVIAKALDFLRAADNLHQFQLDLAADGFTACDPLLQPGDCLLVPAARERIESWLRDLGWKPQ